MVFQSIRTTIRVAAVIEPATILGIHRIHGLPPHWLFGMTSGSPALVVSVRLCTSALMTFDWHNRLWGRISTNQRPVLASDIASATIPLVDLSKRVPEVVLRDFSSKNHPGDA